MMARLEAKMDSPTSQMDVNQAKTNQSWGVDGHNERTEAMMEACLEKLRGHRVGGHSGALWRGTVWKGHAHAYHPAGPISLHGCRVLQSTQNTDTIRWLIPTRIFQHHCRVGSNGTKDRGIKRQLRLGSKRALKTLTKTQELDVVKLAIGSSIWLRKTSVRTLWRSWPPPKRKKRLPSSSAGIVGAPATFESFIPTKRKKKWQYAYGLLGTSSLKEGAMWHDSWKTGILEPEKTVVARYSPINTYPWQQICMQQ
jgi:hypothetical protein